MHSWAGQRSASVCFMSWLRIFEILHGNICELKFSLWIGNCACRMHVWVPLNPPYRYQIPNIPRTFMFSDILPGRYLFFVVGVHYSDDKSRRSSLHMFPGRLRSWKFLSSRIWISFQTPRDTQLQNIAKPTRYEPECVLIFMVAFFRVQLRWDRKSVV